jgi:hypothetical protein
VASALAKEKGTSPRPSPVRKRLAADHAGSPVAVAAVDTTQYSISPMKQSDVEGDDDDDGSHRKAAKREAKWAKKDALRKLLEHQQELNADDIFGQHIGLTCNLGEIFVNYQPRNKKKFQMRTSSAQWSMDGPGKGLGAPK